jgi:hypothetical protein
VHAVLYGLLAVVVAGGLFLLAAQFLPSGQQIAPPLRDEPLWVLPGERSLDAADVDTVRLPVSVRGYRFAETDLLLDRLAGELRARDAEIARLRGGDLLASPEPYAVSAPDEYATPADENGPPLIEPPAEVAAEPVSPDER